MDFLDHPAGVGLNEIICESNFRRYHGNYELSDELFLWKDFPFVLSAENEYEVAVQDGRIISLEELYTDLPWYPASMALSMLISYLIKLMAYI